MKIIRRSMFETNSSSMHSLVLGDSVPDSFVIPSRLEVCYIEQGRYFEIRTVQERYTAAVVMARRAKRLNDLLEMLDSIGVKEKILCKVDGTRLWDGYGIEAQSMYELDLSDCEEYIEEILESEDSLKRWLFSRDSKLSGVDDNDL